VGKTLTCFHIAFSLLPRSLSTGLYHTDTLKAQWKSQMFCAAFRLKAIPRHQWITGDPWVICLLKCPPPSATPHLLSCETPNRKHYLFWPWECSSSGRAPTYQVQGPKVKPQYCKKKKKSIIPSAPPPRYFPRPYKPGQMPSTPQILLKPNLYFGCSLNKESLSS
jgi:hypothetical protein